MLELRPHVGQCRGVIVDMGFDAIWEVLPICPRGRRVGYVGRKRDSPIQFIEPVPDAVIAEARRLVDARDYANVPEEFKSAVAVREVWRAPPPPPPEDYEEDE